MDDKELNVDQMLDLGAWLGRHQAFGIIANRCSAADAECLKRMRDSGEYKKLGLTWEEFCTQKAGISRVYADRLIKSLEEFGANYFRLSEVVPISRDTYRLIAGAISGGTLQWQGECIPLDREHRQRIAAAVESLRGGPRARRSGRVATARKRLDAFLEEARGIGNDGGQRLALLELLDHGAQRISKLADVLRSKTLRLE